MYQGTVRPHFEYGSSAWSTTAKTNQQALDKVQNQALRLITGAMRSTPITEMERLTGVQPLGQRRDVKNMMQAEKFKCLTNHPMKTRLEGLTKNRLKRSSFVHESKKLSRQFHDRLPQSTHPFFPPDMPEPWVTDITDIKVHTTVPSLSDGDTQDDTVKQSLTLAMTAERYPQEAWIHVFTDGPATNAVTNGGAGILVHFPGGQKVSASMAENNMPTMSASVKRRLIRALTMPRLQRDDYHLLFRKQQVILVRLRTGHNRLNSHMHRKLKLAPSPTCPCGQEDQTTEHVIQRCPLYKATREDVWPVSTSPTTKLYGCKQELEKTTSFFSRAALIV